MWNITLLLDALHLRRYSGFVVTFVDLVRMCEDLLLFSVVLTWEEYSHKCAFALAKRIVNKVVPGAPVQPMVC